MKLDIRRHFILPQLLLYFIGQFGLWAQVMTPEKLWSLKRVQPIGLTSDQKGVIYSLTTYDIEGNTSLRTTYRTSLENGTTSEIQTYADIFRDPKLSPSGEHRLATKEVKVKSVTGTDHYPGLEKSNVLIYDSLHYRHWDEWEDGAFSHLFVQSINGDEELDIMPEEPFDVPTKPFGGPEDYVWNPDGSQVLYVCKKEFGTNYAISTNTDIYAYDLATKSTANLTEDNEGYDTSPSFSKSGTLAWLQMDEPGYEADKNDLIIFQNGSTRNLTENWDGTVESYLWGDVDEIYFIAPIKGTKQLFVTDIPTTGMPKIRQITDGVFDITGLIGISGQIMVVTRTDMNHAAEIFSVDLSSGAVEQLTHINDALYADLSLSKIERRLIPTSDHQEMLTWLIYPPDFDSTRVYPALLYCQGGPQSALSQFYSFRWNFQLMAAQGYIVVAPNRRGMPGYGEQWNRQISGDWGGQNIQDYLSAIDAVIKEPYVDENRLGCVGASYGGYSVFYLAGIHENRFKTFIAHDGVFNTQSMYGTTEELFFVNKDFGGSYWQTRQPKAYTEFNPINRVSEWDTPIMIVQGGRDFRVPIGQSLEAFQAAQLRGIKSRLLYFPEENHWVLSPQNGIIWQREFFKWLSETMD